MVGWYVIDGQWVFIQMDGWLDGGIKKPQPVLVGARRELDAEDAEGAEIF